MKMFDASVESIIWRFYLLMAVVIVPFTIGVPILALLALPVFLSALLGVSFKIKKVARRPKLETGEICEASSITGVQVAIQ